MGSFVITGLSWKWGRHTVSDGLQAQGWAVKESLSSTPARFRFSYLLGPTMKWSIRNELGTASSRRRKPLLTARDGFNRQRPQKPKGYEGR